MPELGETIKPKQNLPTVEDAITEAYSDRQRKGDLFSRVGEEKVRRFIKR